MYQLSLAVGRMAVDLDTRAKEILDGLLFKSEHANANASLTGKVGTFYSAMNQNRRHPV